METFVFIKNVDDLIYYVFAMWVQQKKERKWTILQSGSVPYVLASDIQDGFRKCKTCSIEIDKRSLTPTEFDTFLDDQELTQRAVFRSIT